MEILSLPEKVMDCPRCGSLNYRKDGFVNSRQRYECKECHYHYTVAKKSDVKSAETGQSIGIVFGRIGFSGNRSLVTNQLWNSLRLGQGMGGSSGFAQEGRRY
ncbi:hypothetical protein EZS27_012208 [termite gut metagenome]|uniref:Transposase zinc-ribbon domain-containing protein n=1 Tax=termite gut metagenome TaxID=433724 RepID=A0A5J4S146_9ZZZZ